jgi:hypothetical protein
MDNGLIPTDTAVFIGVATKGGKMGSGLSVADIHAHFNYKKDIILLLLLAISLSLNVFLGWRVRSLNDVKRRGSPNPTLREGEIVPPISVMSLDDKQEIIDYKRTDGVTILYIISPECVWCDRNLENINALAKLNGKSYRFIGLSLVDDGLKDYLAAHKFNFPIYAKLSRDSVDALRLGSTPQTIVISPEGRIVKNWVGAYGKDLRPEVESYFKVTLPGITRQN